MNNKRSKTIYLKDAKKRTRRARKAKRSMVILIVIAALAGIVLALLPNAYEVSIAGQKVGVIKRKEYAQKAQETVQLQLEKKYNTQVKLQDTYSLQKVRARKKDFITTDYLASYMRHHMAFTLQLYQMKIDDKVIGIVQSEDILKDLKPELEKAYFKANKEETLETEFANKISFEPVFAKEQEVLSLDKLVEKCTDTSKKQVTYTVVAGDSLYGIANKLNITLVKLLKYNEGLTESTLLKIGMKFQAEVDVPVLALNKIEKQAAEQKENQ